MTQHRKEMQDLSSSECKPVLNYSNALTKPEMDVAVQDTQVTWKVGMKYNCTNCIISIKDEIFGTLRLLYTTLYRFDHILLIVKLHAYFT